jgi:hypothetical protein
MHLLTMDILCLFCYFVTLDVIALRSAREGKMLPVVNSEKKIKQAPVNINSMESGVDLRDCSMM